MFFKNLKFLKFYLKILGRIKILFVIYNTTKNKHDVFPHYN